MLYIATVSTYKESERSKL